MCLSYDQPPASPSRKARARGPDHGRHLEMLICSVVGSLSWRYEPAMLEKLTRILSP